jgi:hypothetical protein
MEILWNGSQHRNDLTLRCRTNSRNQPRPSDQMLSGPVPSGANVAGFRGLFDMVLDLSFASGWRCCGVLAYGQKRLGQ